MRIDKLTTKFQQALAEAQSPAVTRDNPYIEPVHLLLANGALSLEHEDVHDDPDVEEGHLLQRREVLEGLHGRSSPLG